MADTALQHQYREKALRQRSTLAPALVQTMEGLMPQIPALLPGDITVEQFRAALFLELAGSAKLAECTSQSLRSAVIKAAMYGLLPGRDCHILPFKNRKGNTTQATYVPNYFGIILTLERTGKVRKAFAHAVYEGDAFVVDYLADTYSHIPAEVLERQRGPLRFYYGAVVLKDATTHIEIMTKDEVEAIRKRAPAHDEGPWVTDYDMMARKTALKRCAKYVRLTPEQHDLFAEDAAREREDIPDDRHRQNIIDLFQDKSDDPLAPLVNRQTGEIVTEDTPALFDLDASAALDQALVED